MYSQTVTLITSALMTTSEISLFSQCCEALLDHGGMEGALRCLSKVFFCDPNMKNSATVNADLR